MHAQRRSVRHGRRPHRPHRAGRGQGVLGSGSSIEEVRAMLPQVMADTRFTYPANLAERSAMVARVFREAGASAGT